MIEVLAGICGNGVVAIAIWYLANEVKGIREDLKDLRSKEECDERHGRSCERLNNLEVDIKNLMMKGEK